MESIFLNSDERIESRLAERKEKVVTLLIPENYFDRLSSEEQRKLSKKLPYLLRRYAKLLSSRSRLNSKADSILYQNPGKMKKMNFRTNTGYWSLLGALAQAHGVSRCFLFNFLLSLEEAEVGDSIEDILNAGVPTFHDVYRYIWQLDLIQNTITRSLDFSPNPISPFFDMSFPWARSLILPK
ncbi:DUF1564 domain-containing protein [Leptospira stimsonii]|uniref:DUF1564 domain-containing protein n=1 Tax=Leptospira stimsonii TaxID=2202203 RepID=A0A4V3JUN5_9LEPT|nr:DUF1564 domain-containing protein [Leptospira stimsonii]RHX88164.1 DUF1564 domain-containing protein [Leptospira stimsonii]TGK23867.1 DUF1564 domain-containing protein [Leptospira stimsonii]TGM10425.1 DUF1564 domain-containing protein [Leptospira stimsonii]